jgi:hypothetical protein
MYPVELNKTLFIYFTEIFSKMSANISFFPFFSSFTDRYAALELI